MEQGAAEALAAKIAGGTLEHDYALYGDGCEGLGLPVKVVIRRGGNE